jgi:hypothetical protein
MRHPVAPVQVYAKDVHAGARQFQRGGLSEAAARAQYQCPRLLAHEVWVTSMILSSFPAA